jgi:hypothetical protein
MTLNAQTYLSYLARPNSLSAQDLDQLRKLTHRFSYLQSAWTLRWLNAQDAEEKQKALVHSAALTYDRTILLRLQRDPSVVLESVVIEAAQKAIIVDDEDLEIQELAGVEPRENRVSQYVTDARSGFDKQLDEIEVYPRIPLPEVLHFDIEGQIEQGTEKPRTVSTQKTFADWMKLMVSGTAEGLMEHHIENKDKQRKFELLDRFIQDKPKIKADPNHETEFEVDDTVYFDYQEMVTETLALLLFEQKKYGKAIKAYKALMMKIPEKSSFFADQIKKAKALKAKE